MASYVTYEGYAWMRYGDAGPATRPEEQDPLLDRFMPAFEIVERHHIRIQLPQYRDNAAGIITAIGSDTAVHVIGRQRQPHAHADPCCAPVRFVSQWRSIHAMVMIATAVTASTA